MKNQGTHNNGESRRAKAKSAKKRSPASRKATPSKTVLEAPQFASEILPPLDGNEQPTFQLNWANQNQKKDGFWSSGLKHYLSLAVICVSLYQVWRLFDTLDKGTREMKAYQETVRSAELAAQKLKEEAEAKKRAERISHSVDSEQSYFVDRRTSSALGNLWIGSKLYKKNDGTLFGVVKETGGFGSSSWVEVEVIRSLNVDESGAHGTYQLMRYHRSFITENCDVR